MVDLPESVRPIFVAAGWYPGRRVDVHFDQVEGLHLSARAAEVLREFGGLRVGSCGSGRDCAACDIEFISLSSMQDRYAAAQLRSGDDDLFPIGAAHRGHIELFLDSQNRLVAYSVPDGSLNVAGESFQDGVERLLLGYKMAVACCNLRI